MKKYLPWTIRIIIAILFLLSAVAKLYPSSLTALSTFEAKQLMPLGFSEKVAPYFSRFLISAEFAIGLAMLFPYYLKRFVVPVAILLLLIFSGQLSYDIISKGASAGNCGCFGSLIPMTPLQALIKNIIAIGLLVYLFKLLDPDRTGQRFSSLIIIFLGFSLWLFAMAPIQLSTANIPTAEVLPADSDFPVDELVPDFDLTPDTAAVDPTVEIVEPSETDPETPEEPVVIEPEKPKGPKKITSKFSQFTNVIPPAVQIDEGRKILCLFAPGCEHCQETAKILTEMRLKDPNFPPVHIVFMDEEPEFIPEFFKLAGRTYSYRVAPVVDFWKIIDYSRDTPGVAFLWNGNIRYFSDGINEKAFDRTAFKKELDKTE